VGAGAVRELQLHHVEAIKDLDQRVLDHGGAVEAETPLAARLWARYRAVLVRDVLEAQVQIERHQARQAVPFRAPDGGGEVKIPVWRPELALCEASRRCWPTFRARRRFRGAPWPLALGSFLNEHRCAVPS